MKSNHRFAIRLSALATIVALGGCLSDESSTINGAPDPGGTGNDAPTISGNPPAAVKIGDPYSFTPQASDPDGDILTFSIENNPAWASFDTTTGRVSGTPTLVDVGNYPNIRVSVSDGQLSASTPNFTINVTQTATASATLSWTAPTQNSDGTPLTNLAGFRIYYGTSSGNYGSQIQINNPSISTHLVENLTQGTYYFVATAINSSGIESLYSNEAQKQAM